MGRLGELSILTSSRDRTTCHETNHLPDRDATLTGPTTFKFSRHYGPGPTTTIGATIRVTEPPPYRSACGLSRSRRARTEEAGANDFKSTPTVAAAVLQSQDDSDGHCAARMKDKADRARKLTGADISCLIILLLGG